MWLSKKLSQFNYLKNLLLTDIYRITLSRNPKVICPICYWVGKRFVLKQSLRMCPNCHSLSRTRLFAYSFQYFQIDCNNLRILHIGPNINEVRFIVSKFMPKSYDRLDLTDRTVVNRIEDARNTTFIENSLDLIVSWHVFEHIPDDHAVIRETHRILKPSGKILFSVPIHPPGRTETYEDENIKPSEYKINHGHPDHVRSCGLDYGERFEQYFKIEQLYVKNDLQDSEIELFGLKPAHVVWCGSKQL